MYYRLTQAQFEAVNSSEYTHSPTYNLAGTECILHLEGEYIPTQYEQQYATNRDVKAYWSENLADWIEDIHP
jgi:hypothetical protein